MQDGHYLPLNYLLMDRFQSNLASGFEVHQYAREYEIPFPQEVVWEVLMKQSTFRDTQLWPFKVEFLTDTDGDMIEGMENVHHGPFMLFTGEVTRIDAPNYRELQYYLGSYFLSMRLIRPTRLEFHLFPEDNSTRVRLTLSSQVKPYVASIWSFFLQIFWGRFGNWITRYIRKFDLSLKKTKS